MWSNRKKEDFKLQASDLQTSVHTNESVTVTFQSFGHTYKLVITQKLLVAVEGSVYALYDVLCSIYYILMYAEVKQILFLILQ